MIAGERAAVILAQGPVVADDACGRAPRLARRSGSASPCASTPSYGSSPEPGRRATVTGCSRVILPSGLVGLVREVIARYGRLGGSQFAAAISYRALFSLVPLATFVATILAQVLSAGNGNRQDLVSAITDQLDLTAVGRGAARQR